MYLLLSLILGTLRFNDMMATRMLLKKSVSSFSLNRNYSYPLTLSNVREPS